MDLRDFSKRAFDALGGVVEDRPAMGLDILLPDDLVSYFQARDMLRLSFSPEEAKTTGCEAEKVTLGSPILGGLLDVLSKKGLLARAFLNPLHVEGQNIERKFGRKFSWENAKPYFKRSSIEETGNAYFQFKVSFLGDDKRESLYPVIVNLTTFLEHDQLLRKWDHLFFDDERHDPKIPTFLLPDFDRAYEQAVVFVKTNIVPELEKMKVLQENFLRRDLSRVGNYYRDLLGEIERKEAKAAEHPALLEKIRKRRRAVELDHQKKIDDATERYRLDVTVEIVNLLISYQPWMRCVFGFKSQGDDLERVFYWDPVVKYFLDFACESCQGVANRFAVRDQKLICVPCQDARSDV
jgi:hypothetical protein